MKSFHWNHKGFTLAEMAIVVLLGGIMLTMGIKVLTVTMQNTAITETKARQERIRTALIGFLRTNERLPCPDIAATPTGTAPGACNANPAQGYGVVPWTTLGISQNDALDGWGNFFTYRVANRRPAAVVKDWTTTPASTTTSYTIGELSHPSTALTINELNAAGAALTSTTTQAVVIIFSHGKNGFGAKTTKGTNIAPPPAANAGETTNNTATTATFVKRPYTDSSTAFNGPFDDIVDFMTPQDLLQPLINDGTQPDTAESETRIKQERIKTVLLGFLRTNGRLPCPDITAIPTGTAPVTCTATAAAGYGVIPWVTLGISRNDVLDGWGNYFTYKVANRRPAAVIKDWTTTPASTTTSYTIGELSHPSTAFTINELNTAGTAFKVPPLTTQAVVIILSQGKNGFGSINASGTTNAAPPATNAGEVTNNTAATTTFVRRPYTELATAFYGPFDDIVEFMIPQDLLQPLINDGTQPGTAESETRTRQERIKTALVGFLRTNGRLPCPDRAAVPTGTAPAACNANAAQGYGVVPWTTLGISRNDVLDGWGNFFTYKVANRQPGAIMKDWTTRTTPRSFTINELTTSTAALTINELNAAGTALVPTTTQAVAIILSQGKNGFGSINASGTTNANPPAANAGEVTNNTAATTTFVRRPYTELATAFNGPFDDIVEFMTPKDVLQPLINEGSLYDCKHYCATPAAGCSATNIPVGTATATCP
ncbi:MAG: prepilin-type N-terminal cleavage/methylation domain-containing protein [Desulfocapsaceae bacterium]|nr:prepilin-type N-terminal cleavage/methylation domain-containing protein [Desulfocapsaceae bacterium]